MGLPEKARCHVLTCPPVLCGVRQFGARFIWGADMAVACFCGRIPGENGPKFRTAAVRESCSMQGYCCITTIWYSVSEHQLSPALPTICMPTFQLVSGGNFDLRRSCDAEGRKGLILFSRPQDHENHGGDADRNAYSHFHSQGLSEKKGPDHDCGQGFEDSEDGGLSGTYISGRYRQGKQ